MNMKSIITTALLVVALVMTTSCSKETILEEPSYGQQGPSYANGELPAKLTVYKDRAEIKLYKQVKHFVYLNDALITQKKPTGDDDVVVLRALTPDTEYHLYITALDGENVLTKDMTFTTSKPYATLVGALEMNYYDGEEELGFIHQMPGGDFLIRTHKQIEWDDFAYRITRIDSDGQVKWRSNIPYTNAQVSEDGEIAAWTYNKVCRLNPESGSVMYEYSSKLDNGLFNSVCVCSDGGMAIVGKGNTGGKYYFARLDANGQLIHDVESDQFDELFAVHPTADGHLVAIGRRGLETFVAVTFDAEGNVVGESTDYEENRDLGYRGYMENSVSDKQGNIYFLGGSEVNTERGYASAVDVIKVDAQGKIAWVRTLVNEYDLFYATYMNLVDDDKLFALYYGDSGNRLALLTTENELQHDIALNGNYGAMNGWMANEAFTQFYLIDKYGRFIFINTEGE